jgi:hypothetical protein
MPCFACKREPGIGGSSRSWIHEKHDILSFFLGKRSLLVLRFASYEAVLDEPGIGGSSRSFWIFRPSEECAAVGRGRRLGRTARGLKANATSTSAVGSADKVLLPFPAAWAI